MQLRKIVIDVLKPHSPSILEYAEKIAALKNVEGVTVLVSEIDEKTESVEITVEGDSLDYKNIEESIEKLGGSVHSIDMVSAGSQVIEPCNYDEL